MENKVVALVDDEDVFHHLFKMHVNQIDDQCKILSFFNGEEIFSYLSDSPKVVPDILFLDINMPVSNGWSFLENYSALRSELSEIDIYILSSSIDPEDKERARDFEMVIDFFSKPISNDLLNQALNRLSKS
ncbi:response regulator [Ekhidna sp.]|uniref:response regulator n=1 Tax=Ekhidna sp. TaxID=2608089 RepID=UPI003B50E230